MATVFRTRPCSPQAVAALTARGLLPALARALAGRGVTDPEALREDWGALIPPDRLAGVAEAARVLADLRQRGGRVIALGDYDCDGATACALAVRGLRALGLSCDYLVPDRQSDGYGLSPELVERCAARRPRPDLILTVDNGVTALAAAERADELGIELIITDHHLPGPELPRARCLIDPNLPGSDFPSRALAGCGVMFYLLLALRQELRRRGAFGVADQPPLGSLADLVALGTAADVVPLDQNNRILLSRGLALVRSGRACPGIRALLALARRDEARATSDDFGFVIGPRVNAAGRLDSMTLGVDCLLADDQARAQELARRLCELNSQRQRLERVARETAASYLARLPAPLPAGLTLFDSDWHPGVVGLVASRVRESADRPTIVFAPAPDGESLRGSGRSLPAVHLREALAAIAAARPGLIERFGGHALAAGLTIRKDALDEFRDAFATRCAAVMGPLARDRELAVDGPLSAAEITPALVEAIEERVWGASFESPLFANEFRVSGQRPLSGGHLRLGLELDGASFEGVFFGRSRPLRPVARLAWRPQLDDYQGWLRLQLRVEAVEGE